MDGVNNDLIITPTLFLRIKHYSHIIYWKLFSSKMNHYTFSKHKNQYVDCMSNVKVLHVADNNTSDQP